MTFEISPAHLTELADLLARSGVTEAVIKHLRRNHNDKNQIYSGSDFSPLYPMFDVSFATRGPSTSGKKGGGSKGKFIPEATFKSFAWLKADGSEVAARDVKMIIYSQYPETRLSGFRSVENSMPETLSIDFTKAHPEIERFLVLGRRGAGEVLGVVVAQAPASFGDEVEALPSAPGSRTWKHLRLRSTAPERLLALLARVAGRTLPGSRLDASRRTLPFNGTQVCGYTLEHALGIIPNSSKDGDFEGIELKTHTQKKVTLFTPEPDMGVYAADFARFMTDFGYPDGQGNQRLTGIHRVGVRCDKSKLTLRIMNHERGTSLASSADRNVHLGLFDDAGTLAAGWSLERILNNWTSKHNETVYVPAIKSACEDGDLLARGHRHLVEFSDRVLWCRQTSAERLFEALYKGTLFLDPAPKYRAGRPDLTKRRSQWRVNDIAEAAPDLYTEVRSISLPQRVFA
ncbi:MvaI/BcnI family restriction endonuclease [Sphingomonas sp. ASV193]|uniref:MvaI/BcnI family restriction endonuclease n=1 Tax=Sphingomonas sp. ASV193 TaxID=3144405 RepID=UPI0032E8DD6D